MHQHLKPNDPCPWPLDCCPEALAGRPAHADCPRDAQTWLKAVGERRPDVREVTDLVRLTDIVRSEDFLA